MKKYTLAIILVAAIMIEMVVVVQYYLAQRGLKQELLQKASRDMDQSQRVAAVKAEVETAVRNVKLQVQQVVACTKLLLVMHIQVVAVKPGDAVFRLPLALPIPVIVLAILVIMMIIGQSDRREVPVTLSPSTASNMNVIRVRGISWDLVRSISGERVMVQVICAPSSGCCRTRNRKYGSAVLPAQESPTSCRIHQPDCHRTASDNVP